MRFSTPAPTAAADDLAVRDGDEVRAVVDQELIRNGQVDERAGHLFVVVREASDLAQRFPHDAGDAVDVVARRLADLDHFDFSDCTSWATWASPGRMALSFAATARASSHRCISPSTSASLYIACHCSGASDAARWNAASAFSGCPLCL